MPSVHVVPAAELEQPVVYISSANGQDQPANILQQRGSEVYVHYINTDKRMDEWVSESRVKVPHHNFEEDEDEDENRMVTSPAPSSSGSAGSKRKRDSDSHEAHPGTLSPEPLVDEPESLMPPPPPRLAAASATADSADTDPQVLTMTEEEYDIKHHKQITAQRNFDKVNFASWQIKTWYFSPYPLTENEDAAIPVGVRASSASSSNSNLLGSGTPAPRITGVTPRAHGRTSDMFAAGLGRNEHAVLWVCDRCFKYMADGMTWELHTKKCQVKHPPGQKVYQRGAHIIWEVDGAKEKLFCQNLALFGKLFIDVKTLFFDLDNFLFYILTDADSTRDHVIGFFSKEKVTYDEYNLNCIVTLPPFQRQGYGMLLIEFSYELSRRAGKVGTPERPLSDLGLRSYLAYWVATIIRFLRRLLSVVPPECEQLYGMGTLPSLNSPISPELDDAAARKKKKRTKGWDGEKSKPAVVAMAPLASMNDPLFTTHRAFEMVPNPDGSATAHVLVRCTLADIARATNLRIDDAAFALNEIGLLDRRGDGSRPEIVLSREMIEKVAKERNVKIPCMDLEYVLL